MQNLTHYLANNQDTEEIENIINDFAVEIIESAIDDMKRVKAAIELRDQFAMSALNGLIASSNTNVSSLISHHFAQIAYEIADAMLKAREIKAID